MKDYNLSDTYKILYDYIIGDLLSQIFEKDHKYCIRNREIPFLIGEKFEVYKNNTLKHMSGTRLDRHKLAACICGAIIEVKPLIGFNGTKIPKNANETLALFVGVNVIKFYMMYSSVSPLNLNPEITKNVIQYLRENFSMQFPTFDKNICDTQNYQKNLINSLYWTHESCNITKKECFHFDVWAYSKIFYHLELYNKECFENFFQNYIKTQ